MYKPAIILLSGVLLTGCFGASTNPREGGLFGYNPTAYEQRIQERERLLNQEKTAQSEYKAEQSALELERSNKQKLIAAQQRKIDALQNDLNKTRNNLNNLKAANNEQQNKINELKKRRQGIDSSLGEVNKLNTAAKERKIKELQQALNELEKEADALSQIN